MRHRILLVPILVGVLAVSVTAQTIRIGAPARAPITENDVLMLHEYDKASGQRYGTMPLRYVTEIRRRLSDLMEIAVLDAAHGAAYATREAAMAAGQGVSFYNPVVRSAWLQSGDASVNALSVLRVQPALGRDFSDADVQSGRRVAILTAGAWQRMYQSRPDVIGTSVWKRGGGDPQAFEIIGVLPPGAMTTNPEIDPEQDVLLLAPPLRENAGPEGRCFAAVVRLKSGVTLDRAQRAIDDAVTAAQRALGRPGDLGAILDTLRRGPAAR